MPDPQAGVYIIGGVVDKAELHGAGGVDEDDGMVEIFVRKTQKRALVFGQFQISRTRHAAAVAVFIHGERSALRARPGKGDDRRLIIADRPRRTVPVRIQPGSVCIRRKLQFGRRRVVPARPAAVVAGAVYADVGGSGGVRQPGSGCVAARLCQPFVQIGVDVEAGAFKGVFHHHGALVVFAAARTRTAQHIVDGHRAEQRDLGTLCQRQHVALVFEQDGAFFLNARGDIHALLVQLFRGVVAAAELRRRTQRRGDDLLVRCQHDVGNDEQSDAHRHDAEAHFALRGDFRHCIFLKKILRSGGPSPPLPCAGSLPSRARP